MDELFKIYLESLRGGKTEKIQFRTTPNFLDVSEEDLKFNRDVHVTGEAYIADDVLILHLNATAHAVIPCSICNAPVEMTVNVHDFYHAEPLEELKSGYFNFQEIIREAIVLETPPFAECREGNCPRRQEFGKYLKADTAAGDGHKPFADINLDQFNQ